MPTLKPNAWKLLCFILRKTNGWNKTEAQLSYNQLRAGTGIQSDATLSATIKELADAHYILVTPIQWQSSMYELNYQYIVTDTNQPGAKEEQAQTTAKTVATTEIEDATEIEGTSKTVVPPTSISVVPPTTEIEDIKRKVFKEKGKESERVQPEAPQPAQTPPLPLSAHSQPAAGGFESLLNAARENANGDYGKRREQVQIDDTKKKLKEAGMTREQFNALVDEHLAEKGTKSLADGDGKMADDELRLAREFVLALISTGKRFREVGGIKMLWNSWRTNDKRPGPSESQLVKHAHQMVNGKIGNKNGVTLNGAKPAGVYVGVAENLK
jgi:hypothetical protein